MHLFCELYHEFHKMKSQLNTYTKLAVVPATIEIENRNFDGISTNVRFRVSLLVESRIILFIINEMPQIKHANHTPHTHTHSFQSVH